MHKTDNFIWRRIVILETRRAQRSGRFKAPLPRQPPSPPV